jgi:hypothetical protein
MNNISQFKLNTWGEGFRHPEPPIKPATDVNQWLLTAFRRQNLTSDHLLTNLQKYLVKI